MHNGFTGQNPPTVTVTSDSVFTVYYTNSIDDTCTANIIVQTIPPVFTVTSVNDTSLCGSGCVELHATADILVRPASQPNFENTEAQPLAPLGTPTVIPINVGGVDITTVGQNSVLSVCLNVNNPTLFPLVDVSTLSVTLSCPNGTSITLIAPGSVGGQSLSNTCFTSTAITPITSGTAPYSGSYLPLSGSLNDFLGCDVNGVWTMTITNNTFFAIGFFNSWDITFDVPEISYQGIYEWSPTTGLSDPFSLNPTACPENTTTYTLSVRDSNNCATFTHDVTIATTAFDITNAETVKPQPGEANGEITIITAGGLAPYHYSVDNGLTSQDSSHFTGLPAGTYPVLVTDAGGCSDTITVVLDEFEEILIPNIINPNSQIADNKVFMIKGMEEPELFIYNRWGKKIYHSGAYKNDWDGDKYHDGVYYYVATDKEDGKIYTGFFTLGRF